MLKTIASDFLMKKFMITVVALLTLGATTVFASDKADQAGAFLQNLRDEAVEKVKDDSLSADERSEEFKALIARNFDIEDTARFVVGRFWRKADKQERSDFTELFQNILVQRFLPVFEEYAEAEFKVVESKKRKDYFIVTTTILTPNGEPANLFWRVDPKGENSFRIKDVAPEGISMRSTYREDYTSALKSLKGDMTEFNAKLREKLNKS